MYKNQKNRRLSKFGLEDILQKESNSSHKGQIIEKQNDLYLQKQNYTPVPRKSGLRPNRRFSRLDSLQKNAETVFEDDKVQRPISEIKQNPTISTDQNTLLQGNKILQNNLEQLQTPQPNFYKKESDKLKKLFKHRFSSDKLKKTLQIKHMISCPIEKDLFIEYLSESQEKKFRAYSNVHKRVELKDKIEFCEDQLNLKIWRKNSMEMLKKIKLIQNVLNTTQSPSNPPLKRSKSHIITPSPSPSLHHGSPQTVTHSTGYSSSSASSSGSSCSTSISNPSPQRQLLKAFYSNTIKQRVLRHGGAKPSRNTISQMCQRKDKDKV